MTVTFEPGARCGEVYIPSSKSQMHRLLICAALGETETRINFCGISDDITATMKCLNALGADIEQISENVLKVVPIERSPEGLCHLECGESGSTLRFMMPVCGVLGADAVFHMKGRLPNRPLAPFDEELSKHGMTIKKEDDLLYVSGKLAAGEYTLPGNVSSQFISGLLMALPLLDEQSQITVTGKIESEAYINMTTDVLSACGACHGRQDQTYTVKPSRYSLPREVDAEGDYSNAAFFLCLGAMSDKGVNVLGLKENSSQGDSAVLEILSQFGAQVEKKNKGFFVKGGDLKAITIDASPIPDLIPVLSVVAAFAEGETRVINAARLRMKESDRLSTTADLLKRLGADVTELEDGLVINGGKKLHGACVSSFGDHRIAMSAAVASSVCTSSVTVDGCECTAKSYPKFCEDFSNLEFC